MVSISDKWKPALYSLIFLLFGVGFVTQLMPFLALTLGRGAEVSALIDKVQLFGLFGASFGIILSLMGVFHSIHLVFPSSQKVLGWVGALIHDYDSGLISSLSPNFKFFKSVLNQLLVFLPFLFIIGFYGITQTGIPFFEAQQVTEIGKGIISIEPAGSEMFILAFLLSLIVYPLKWIGSRKKWNKTTYWSIAMPSGLFIGTLYGIVIHILRYGDSNASLFAVGIFWFTSALLILLFGGIVLAWVFKDVNNFFQYLKEGLRDISSDTRVFIVVIIFVLIMVFLGFLKIVISQMKKKRDGG